MPIISTMRTIWIVSVVAAVFGTTAIKSEAVEDFPFRVSENDVHIYYYSQKLLEGKEITHKNYVEDISQTDFDSTKKTIFTVHGWHNNFASIFCEDMKDAYLSKYDVNVFVVDWHQVASMPYIVAFFALPDVAATLGKLIRELNAHHGLSLDNTLIVGHSLGAHIAGLTGAALNGSVDTIIGLDPAGPGFPKEVINGRLDRTDAKFVQALHTCPVIVGEGYPVGHADYFANVGIFQPGCPVDPIDGLRCSHLRAYEYFAESVTKGGFKAVSCQDYNTYITGACAKNPVSYVGQFDVDKNASGLYFFETNASPPYAKSSGEVVRILE